MKHAFIDTYANLNTPLHKLNVKTKFISLIIFLFVIIFTPIEYISIFFVYSFVIITLLLSSRVPVSFILKRFIHILPFVILISFSALFRKGGRILFISCLVKASLIITLVLIFSSTTKFDKFLKTLRQLKAPGIFVSLLSFMYRYLFLLEDQLLRTKRAYYSRNINKINNFKIIRTLSNILAVLFIRTFERAERVYLAMCARGYNSEKDN